MRTCYQCNGKYGTPKGNNGRCDECMKRDEEKRRREWSKPPKNEGLYHKSTTGWEENRDGFDIVNNAMDHLPG